jgi:hypothetical protein
LYEVGPEKKVVGGVAVTHSAALILDETGDMAVS